MTGAADDVLGFLPLFKAATAQVGEAAANGAGLQWPTTRQRRVASALLPFHLSPRPRLIGSQCIGLAAVNTDFRACWILSQTACRRDPYLVCPHMASRSRVCVYMFDSQNGNTVLLLAAMYGRAAAAETLLDRGADVGHENKVRRPFFGLVVLFGGVDFGTQVWRCPANFRRDDFDVKFSRPSEHAV